MNFKPDEMMISNVIFAIIGAAFGYVSEILSKTYGIHELNFIILLIIIFATKTSMEFAMKTKHDWKWWISNGAALAVLAWLVVWTVFFNIGL